MRKLVFLLLFPALILSSGNDKLYGAEVDVYSRTLQTERSREYDAIHYRIKLRFDQDKGMFWGETSITLSPLSDGFEKCSFDAEKFIVSAVRNQSGQPLKFSQGDGKIVVSLGRTYDYGEEVSVTVLYVAENCGASSNFPPGISMVEANDEHPRLIQALSFPRGARHWFPCYDHPNDKATIEVIATVNEEYKVLSNGKLVSVTEDTPNKTKTFHWKQDRPHSTYLTVLAAGPYHIIEDSLGDLPINYWVYPKDAKNAKLSFSETPEIIAFFNREFGYEYPWDKYDQITIPGIGGGAECTSATLLGQGVIHDEKADKDFPSRKLIAHEAAHQWWGDLVTLRDWGHTWINESFGTYSDYLYIKHSLGADEGAVDLLDKKNAYLREAHNRYTRPIVFHRWDEPGQNFDSHTYPKGAAIINMMRWILGDKPFRKTISHFLHKHAYAPADTNDFIVAVKEMTGQNLEWFFEQWLYSPGHPVFDVSWRWDDTDKKVILKIAQTQDTSGRIPIFKTPVVIAVVTAKGKKTEKVWIDEKVEEFEFTCDEKPLMVRFDEGNFLLKEWTFVKTTQELIYQLKHDDVIGRMWAAQQLGNTDNPSSEIISALFESAQNDPFWSVRKTAIENVPVVEKDEHIDILKRICSDENSSVRTAALKALAKTRKHELVAFFKERFQLDESYLAQAQALTAIANCGDNSAREFLKEAAKIESHRDIITKAAQAALEKIDKLTPSEKTIRHARENLPECINTEDKKLTDLAHSLYEKCLFDKLWEPKLPGLPYRWFSISGIDDSSYGKCQLQWDTMFILNDWAPLDDDALMRDVFHNYWNVIDNNPEAPKGSYRYGMVPCVTKPELPQDGFSQIPILAWGCQKVFQQTNDPELLELCLPYLDAFMNWYSTERDTDNDGLIEYGAYKKCSIRGIIQTARFETFDRHATLDNLKLTKHPRRDSGGDWYGNIEGVEQTCFLLMSERAMVELAKKTGRLEMAGKYERNIAKRISAMQKKMWDPKTNFFYSLDRDSDKKIPVRTIQGFLTLTCGAASPEQAEHLAKQLKDPKRWWPQYPVTTTAMDEPTFDPKGFWRGDMWPPTNYLVTLGLNRYGYYDIARELTDKMLQLVEKYDGQSFERYDGTKGVPLGVPDYCWGPTIWSMVVHNIYGIQEDYRTIVVPPHAKGRRLKLGKLELSYPSDKSLEVRTLFEREFTVIFPGQKGEVKVQSDGENVKFLQKDVPVPEVTFIASPHKTYVVSI